MNDGPLIVQSDKTLLLEIDHERGGRLPQGDRPVRRARALAGAHPHLPADPAGPVERRAPPATTPSRWSTRCSPGPLRRPARAARRRRRDDGPLRAAAAGEAPRPRPGADLHRPPGARGGAARQEGRRDARRRHRRRHRRRAPSERGNLKQALLKLGWPAEDFAGYVDGEAHAIDLDEDGWTLRAYQREAAESFWHGGSGVVVLPCGAGKTIVGAAAMAQAQATTLILVTNTVSARQWKDELVRRTSLTEDEIGEYSGSVKEIRPVTIATYQVMTTRRKGVYPHLELLDARDWGLIVYDEVHLLPAPIFRMTADLAGPPPDRPDRDAGARGRPRGRRLLADRAQALRRPVEGHRGAGLDRAGRLRRGAGDAAGRRAARLRHGRARRALPAGGVHPRQDRRRTSSWSSSTAASRRW